ncbi:GNAT family N-acetyltransferase [Sphingomonas sp. CBMAI 2297]|uniref:GNAT family N-acetyltransferase n=1 Tax=Sphingomonas sp. CBMAI 2297 TaxID=2991720 RepID=UPI0024555CF9|nr:GNAT family N-acetyltransferase [Sphingomonas sp. CBMAI 2297]
MAMLGTPMAGSRVRLAPFGDAHVEPLRAACAEDPEIWEIYPVGMAGAHFDPSLRLLRAMPGWTMFAVLDRQAAGSGDAEKLVGMTSYIPVPGADDAIEIGATYIAPDVRGGPFNTEMKQLMIERAFARGYAAIQFRIDTRNARSRRAVEKLGAGLMEVRGADLTTWTGHVRDTAVYRLARGDWAA